MEKMEHFREARLLEGERVVMEGLDGHLGFHARSGGRKEWYGYFELPDSQHLEAGVHYDLILEDGRKAEIYAGDVQGSHEPGKKHVTMFYVIGDIQNQRKMGLSGSGIRAGLGGGLSGSGIGAGLGGSGIRRLGE